jgi:DNA-binding Lrp family transcriptional regulator
MTDLDPISARILRELQQDGRISNLALAERVGLSPSACLRRVQDLECRGVIRGWRAVTDRALTGRGFLVFVSVGLTEHTKAAQEIFERAVARAPEVVECHNIAGAFEYLLRVECADMTAYKQLHTEVLGTIPTVRALTSYIVMDSPKDERG